MKDIASIYAAMGPKKARAAAFKGTQITRAMQRSVENVGSLLIEVKEMLPHGTFGDWCKGELGISPRSAQNYMNAASFLEGKSETLSLLPTTLLYELASPKADPGLVTAVVEAAAAGTPLEISEVKSRLLQSQQNALELKAMQRRAPETPPEKLKQRRAREREEGVQRHEDGELERQTFYDAAVLVAEQIVDALGADCEALVELLKAAGGGAQLTRALGELLEVGAG